MSYIKPALVALGTLLDMYSEIQNDDTPEEYSHIPTQQDFDGF